MKTRPLRYARNAADMTRQEANRFLNELNSTTETCPCEHGHMGCSTMDEGPCCDEVLNRYPSLA